MSVEGDFYKLRAAILFDLQVMIQHDALRTIRECLISSQSSEWKRIKVLDTTKQEPGRCLCIFPECNDNGGE